MRSASISLMMLLSSVGLSAQTGTGSTAAILTPGPASVACPIGFSVRRRAASEVLFAKDAAQIPHNQGLQLKFDHMDASNIVQADITVHGMSGNVRKMPASAGPASADPASADPASADPASADPASADMDTHTTEIFELRSKVQAASLFQSEIWMTKLNAVSWVELTEIKYADGSVWHASAGSQCRAVPNGYLLVAETR